MIDECPACGGVWLDADELDAIRALSESWLSAAGRSLPLGAAENISYEQRLLDRPTARRYRVKATFELP